MDGHETDRLPFQCKECRRRYSPPKSDRRRGSAIHYACTLSRSEHQPPVPKYSKTGHRDDCPVKPFHKGRQGQSCPACKSIYVGRDQPIPTGQWNDHEHWHCAIPPEDHKSVWAYGQGHRPGCGVADGHTPGSNIKGCAKCRHAYQASAVKTARLKREYQLSREEFDAMLAAQNGRCAICGAEAGERPGLRASLSLHVDHSHVSGKVRGLLCYRCNSGLGLFRDDPALLLVAAEYLRGQAEA